MVFISQEKQPTIAGSTAVENNIRHYIKAMAPQISAIILLGYPPINAVGHFMACLNTKHTRLYIKHACVDMGFVMRWLHIVCHTICLLAFPLHTSCFAKRLNNAFNNKMGTQDSKMHTSLNIYVKNCC